MSRTYPSDPPAARAEKQEAVGYTLGVDVGTTYTAVGICRDGRAEIAPLGNRGWSAPSVVYLAADRTVLVGDPAVRRSATDPPRVVREFKRRVGDQVPLLVGGAPVSADTLTAIVLRAVVQEVVALETGPPDHVVVTHPANWGRYKTECLWQAIRIAGLDELGPVSLMSEPEAAAAFYASTERLEPGDLVAVYDLGGGTFDAAVLRRTGSGWELPAPSEGIERLGGIDFDEAVLSFVDAATDGRLRALDPTDPTTMAALLQVRRDCVEAKEALSSDTDTVIRVAVPGCQTDVRLHRAEFESMIEPSVRVSIDALQRVLRSAGVPPERLRAVLLVGGSSRIPLVGQLVEQTLRVPVAVDAHPKHSIALGAALTAYQRATGGPLTRPQHTNPMSPANLPTPPVAPPGRVPAGPPNGPPAHPPAGSPGGAPAAPVRRRRWLPIAAAVAVLVIGGTTAVLLTRGGSEAGGGGPTSAASAPTSPTGPTSSLSSDVRALPKSALPLPDSELAFASRQNDNMDVWTMQGSDGSGKKRLVNVPGVDDYLPAISPDRRSVAYIRIRGLQSELHIVAADGTGDIALTTELAPDARPSWSPDGTTLVFASAIDGQTDLYTASFEFSDKPPRLGPLTRLTNSPATEADPAWSPDGRRIVYWSNASGVQNLYWVAPDGGAETQLTDGPDTDADPTWAPDSQRIAFTRTTQSAPSDIYSLAIDSAGRAVGAPTNLTADLAGPDEDASWSADGGAIAFVHKADTGADIWVMDVAGAGKKPITDNKDWDGHPAWGPFATE